MKKTFVIYTDYEDRLSELTDEEVGILFRNVFKYVKTGEVSKMDRVVKSAFNMIKVDLDENNKKYEKRVEANKNNGKKGGRPKLKITQNNPMGFSETQQKPKNLDSDSDSDSELLTMSNLKKENIQRKKFIKPSLEEVKEYCEERKNKVNAEKFIDYYNANGWKVGRNAMKDWKACVRNWERNDGSFSVNNKKPDWFDKTIEKQEATIDEQKEMEELLKEFE